MRTKFMKGDSMDNIVNIGTQRFGVVVYLDDKGHGGAHHEYRVRGHDGTDFASASFQNGPIKESGVNGCHHEDLIAIVLHRLTAFQDGEYRCRENDLAITKLEEALHWLNHRTAKRQERDVEGTSTV